MGVGVSIFLVALGAILAFAVEVDAEGFNLNMIGWILMVVGAIGALLSMTVWSTRGRDVDVRRERRVIDRDPV